MSRSAVFESSLLKKKSITRWIFKSSIINNLMFQSWLLKNRAFRNRDHPSREEYLAKLGDQLKDRYDDSLDVWTDQPGDRMPARWFFDRLPPGEHHLLDIGTGRGRDLEEFLQRGGHRATGLELFEIGNWPEMRARWGDRLNLVITPLLEFRPEKPYSAIFSLGAFGHQHPSEYAPFLSHVRDLLAPGGHFMLCVLHKKNERPPGDLVYADDRFWRFFTTQEIRELLEGAGFRWVESFSHHDSFFPYLMALVTH
jgi:SAM-dependent methyltransferase